MTSVSCNDNGSNPNCICPTGFTKELIPKGENKGNPDEDRYFCSYISRSCKKHGYPNKGCLCNRNASYRDCYCEPPGRKTYIPGGTVPNFSRDFFYCCGNPNLPENYKLVCQKYEAIYGKVLPVPTTSIPSPPITSPTTPSTPTSGSTSSSGSLVVTPTQDSSETIPEPTIDETRGVSTNGGTLPVSSEPEQIVVDNGISTAVVEKKPKSLMPIYIGVGIGISLVIMIVMMMLLMI